MEGLWSCRTWVCTCLRLTYLDSLLQQSQQRRSGLPVMACRHYVPFERPNLTPRSLAPRCESDALGRSVMAPAVARVFTADRDWLSLLPLLVNAASWASQRFLRAVAIVGCSMLRDAGPSAQGWQRRGGEGRRHSSNAVVGSLQSNLGGFSRYRGAILD